MTQKKSDQIENIRLNYGIIPDSNAFVSKSCTPEHPMLPHVATESHQNVSQNLPRFANLKKK